MNFKRGFFMENIFLGLQTFEPDSNYIQSFLSLYCNNIESVEKQVCDYSILKEK